MPSAYRGCGGVVAAAVSSAAPVAAAAAAAAVERLRRVLVRAKVRVRRARWELLGWTQG